MLGLIIQERWHQLRTDWRHKPNKISLSRLLVGIAFLVLWPRAPFLALPVLIYGALSDLWDGYDAKTKSGVTLLGIWLDPLMDKVMMFFVWVSLWLPMVGPWWLAGRVAIEIALVISSGFHERLRLAHGHTLRDLDPKRRQSIEAMMRANWSGKAKTAYEMSMSVFLVFLGTLGLLGYAQPYGLALFVVGLGLGIISILVHALNYREAKSILRLHDRMRRMTTETWK